MALTDLLGSLRADLGDGDGVLFDDAALTRCLHKSAYILARDMESAYAVESGEIVPEPEGETRELLLLLARIHACQIMRSVTANGFSFASGDKRVDKTRQSQHWADLENDLKAQYKARLSDIKPEATLHEDNYFVSPGDILPLIYEQGSQLL